MVEGKHIILFDGACNFCSFWVKFVIKRDKKDQFRFASLQSEAGKKLLEMHRVDPLIDSVVLIKQDKAYIKSTATLHIIKLLGGFRALLFGLIIFPSFLRDFFYDLIARNRYKWFGQKTCELPLNPDFKNKFIM
ncbi:MAG: DUF393 domain-containing protein [Flavobacteriales bacterium]|nr:DUF393 domain-containing protein [Flavobacteriales bacterium]